jgi:hypothetical protein
MVRKKVALSNRIYQIPIPKNAVFSGPLADHLAYLSYRILMMTSQREDYREKGFFIPFSRDYGRRIFGGQWDQVKRLAASEYSHIFHFNEKYSYLEGQKGFPKSVRLEDEYRTGEVELYTLRRSRPAKGVIGIEENDKTGMKLVEDFDHFYLPECPPDFDNAWQAFTWSRIAAKDFYASKCEFGRFHSNFTAFKHRDRLQCDGGATAIDIVACQPLILGGLVLEHFGPLPDVVEWIRLCSEEDPYERLAALNGTDRSTTKANLIQCIFERRFHMQAMAIYRLLAAEFPTIARYLLEIKEVHYERVAHNCQRRESLLLIEQAVKDLGEIPVVTVHDEFIVPSKYADKVQNKINRRFLAAGLKPQFKRTEHF